MFNIAFFDGIVDYGNAYRSQLEQLNERLKQTGQAFTQAKREKDELAKEVESLKAKVADLEDKALARDVGAGKTLKAVTNGKPAEPAAQ